MTPPKPGTGAITPRSPLRPAELSSKGALGGRSRLLPLTYNKVRQFKEKEKEVNDLFEM